MFIETDVPVYKRLGERSKKRGIKKLIQLLKDLILEFDILHVLYFQVGLMIGRASLSSELFPFGLAFLGFAIYQSFYQNEESSRVIFFVISIYIGYYTVLGFSWLLAKYLLAGLLFIMITTYVIHNHSQISKRNLAILNGGILLIIEIANMLLFNSPLYYDLVFILGAILVGVLTLILIEGLSPLFCSEAKQNLAEINILALLIMISALNIGIPNISVGIINLSRLFSSSLIMLVALSGGGIVASILGIIIGLFYSISNLYIIEVTALYALAGLIGGNFRKEGKLAVVAGFFLTALLYTIFLVDVNNINAILAEALAAGCILFLIPNTFVDLLKNFVPRTRISFADGYEEGSGVQQEIIEQVNEVADIFTELSNTFQQVSTTDSNQTDNLEELLSIITNQVCIDCEFYNICWEQEFFKTYQQAIEVFSIAEKRGRIEVEKLDEIMQGDCKSSVKLCEMVNRFLEKYETNNLWQQKLKDSKEVIGNQMLGVSKILEELVNDLKVENTFEGDLKKLIQRELETQGIFIEDLDISDYQNETMISLNKKSCMGSQECMNKIVPILNQTLGQQFKVEWSSCGGNLGSNRCSLQIVPGPRYWVGTGVVQVSPDEEVVSGDDYKIIESDNEEFVSILSDGMGRGQRAALESRTTVSLLEKLIKAGFDKELAIKIINSTLLLRSTEEVFSTVDIKTIDCHNGEAEFVKIGSAPTFIKRNNREIDIIRGSSLPIGIIDNVGVESTQSLQLSPGDMVIMVTDGVLDAQEVETRQEEWMMRLLQNNLINDPQSLAEYIIEQAKETKNEISDDMTVLVAKLNGFQNK